MLLDLPNNRSEALPVLKIKFEDLTDLRLAPVMIQSQGVLNDVDDDDHMHLVIGASVARYEENKYLLFVKSFLWEARPEYLNLEDHPAFNFSAHDDIYRFTGQETWLLSESHGLLARVLPLDGSSDFFNSVLLDGFQMLFSKHGMGANMIWKKPLTDLDIWPEEYGDDYPDHLRHESPFDV